jgi:hypothetical protein
VNFASRLGMVMKTKPMHILEKSLLEESWYRTLPDKQEDEKEILCTCIGLLASWRQ